MDFSVVLCTWNNEARLRETLEAFCVCVPPSGRRWEFVVVNNNSTDETDAVITSFSDRLPINYVYEPKQGLSHARNAGLAEASGELIIFTDDDVFPCKQWLQIYWQAYQRRPQGYYFGGPVVSRFEVHPPDEELLRHAPWSVRGLNHGVEDRALRSTEKFLAANWACPRKYLDEVGGFDPALGLNADSEKPCAGEEKDLMQRLDAINLTAWYLHRAEIEHFVPASKCTIEHIATRKEAAGYSNVIMCSSQVRVFSVLGVPLGLYRVYLCFWMKWKLNFILGRGWGYEYIKCRSIAGKIKAYRDMLGKDGVW